MSNMDLYKEAYRKGKLNTRHIELLLQSGVLQMSDVIEILTQEPMKNETYQDLEPLYSKDNIDPESISNAVIVLSDALKGQPDYYYSWQSSIAMPFKDAVSRKIKENRKNGKGPYLNRQDLHECANEAAKEFLNQLTK